MQDTVDDIRRQFDSGTFARGQAYAREGKLRKFAWTKNGCGAHARPGDGLARVSGAGAYGRIGGGAATQVEGGYVISTDPPMYLTRGEVGDIVLPSEAASIPFGQLMVLMTQAPVSCCAGPRTMSPGSCRRKRK